MKVLHLVPSVGPTSGGMGTVALALAGGQRDGGLDARVWCVDPPAVVAAAAPSGVAVSHPVVGPRRFAWSPRAERIARTIDVDVVHQHGLWTAQARITETVRGRGVPTIVAPHGSLEAYALHRSALKKRIALGLFESSNLHAASCLHATTPLELRTFRDFGLRAPVAILPNAVAPGWLDGRGDGARFLERHRLEDRRRVMLFLSRIHPIKGLPLLLDGFAANRDRLQNWRLVIAGPDSDGHLAEMERLANRLGLSNDVRFVGPLFDEEKRDAFAAAQLFVLPTHSENFGLVLAEALASGVPVVTTHGAPWPSLEAEGCGWWVACDSRSIGDALVAAGALSPGELRAMGTRGRALIASSYTWPSVTGRTADLYTWLRGNGEKPDFVVTV